MNNRNLYGLYGKLFAKYIGLEVAAGEMVRSTYSAAVLKTAQNVIITAPSATFRQEAIGCELRLDWEEDLSIRIVVPETRYQSR